MRANPFSKSTPAVEPQPSEEVALHDPLMGHVLIEHGPRDPRNLPITSEDVRGDLWPKVPIPAENRTRITVMGLHGGAGATTFATLLGPGTGDHGQAWPEPEDGAPLGVVAVCRSHWRGLEAADRFTQQWAAEMLTGATLLALVVVDDGPTLSDGQRRAVKRLLKRTPRGVHVPWVEAWRHASPDAGRIPGRITRITRALHGAAADL